jgi:hypothetical protein
MEAIDPSLKTPVFNYTDTDSLCIKGEHYFKLKEMGLIRDHTQDLGYLCNDLKNDAIIVKQIALAPKTKLDVYIDKNGKINSSIKTKGIPLKTIKDDMEQSEKEIIKEQLKQLEFCFERNREKKIEFDTLKRIHTKITSKQQEQGIKDFSIVSQTNIRTFNKSKWGGMELINNEYYPKGYKFKRDMFDLNNDNFY